MYRGDIRLGDTIDIKFTTVDTSGVPITLAGTPVVSAYVGNGTTEITAGITLTVDFDSRTGLHNVRVAATAGNGFATATNVELVITTGTIGGSSAVGYVVGAFSIENRSAVMPTTAARTLDVSATGEAGIDWANVGSPTTAVNLSATNIDVDQIVASVSGAVGSVSAAVAITSNVKKNQALSAFEFLMTDSTNHAPVTGAVVTVTRSIDGGAFVAGTLAAVTEVSNGIYRTSFLAADLNGNVIVLRATAAACDDTFERIITQP